MERGAAPRATNWTPLGGFELKRLWGIFRLREYLQLCKLNTALARETSASAYMPRLSNERGDSLSAHVSSCIPACLCLCLCHCDPAVRPHPGRLCRYSNPHIGWPWYRWVCSTIEVHLQLLSSSLKDGYSQALRALCCTSSGFAVTVDKLQRKHIYSVRWSPLDPLRRSRQLDIWNPNNSPCVLQE